MTVLEAHPPALSFGERDRRWSRVREFLGEHELSCVLAVGLRGRERFEGYLANETLDGIVVFPADPAPVHLTWAPTKVTGRFDAVGREHEYWIDDTRSGRLGTLLPEVLAELGCDRGRVGVVGLASNGPAEAEGIVPHAMWAEVARRMPTAEFVDVSFDFSVLMLAKSEEEIALARYAALVGERACHAMLDTVGPGVAESEVYASVLHTIYRHAAATVPPHLIMRTGTEHFTIGAPPWLYTSGGSRLARAGDLVQAEIFSVYGGIETQQQMSVAVGQPDREHAVLADVARRCYEAGLAALRPGVGFAEVDAAMQEVVLGAGCWHIAPLVQTLAPIVLNGAMCHGSEQLPDRERYHGLRPLPRTGDAQLRAGMLIELEPNACRGPHRVTVGGTVLITDDGAEELNDLPTRLNVRPA